MSAAALTTRTPPTRFSDIVFSPSDHAYIHAPTATPLISATTVLRSIKPPFDRDAISARTAAKRGISQAEVLAEWEASSIRALNNGSAVHAYAEDILNARIESSDLMADESADPAGRVVELGNDHLPEVAGFRRAWDLIRVEFDATVLATETVVGDLSLGVAGTVDCIVAMTNPGECWIRNGTLELMPARRRHVFDWKTGKRFNATNNFGEKLLPPFDDLDNCELNVYSLQTSIYRLILERNELNDDDNPDGPHSMPFGDSFLVHLAPDGSHYFYRGIDYRERVEEWLRWRLF